MRLIRIAEFAGGEQANGGALSTGLGRRVGGEAVKELIDLIFYALAFLIKFIINNKKIKVYKNIGDDLNFDLNFWNIKYLFIFKGVMLKLIAREKVIIIIVNVFLQLYYIINIFDLVAIAFKAKLLFNQNYLISFFVFLRFQR